MELHLTPDQEAFVKQGIASGRYHDADDAVRTALSRWEEIERSRIELLACLDEAEADLHAGQYRDYTDQTLPQLADELKQEARSFRA